MHPNPDFRQATVSTNIAFARERAFGTLVFAAEGEPIFSHVPFLVSDDGQSADFHLIRSNPIARAIDDPISAALIVQGPDGYISPDWYGAADQVPTWNYVAVHLRGRLERLPQTELKDLLDRQAAHFEATLLPKTPWATDKMTATVMEKMMRQIVPFQMTIDAVDGTWKLNQNKPGSARLGAARQVGASRLGHETRRLAALMSGAVDDGIAR